MDSGFLSSSTEMPKAPEQAVPPSNPEVYAAPSQQPVVEQELPQEQVLEAEAVQVQPAAQVVAAPQVASAEPEVPVAIAAPVDQVTEDVQKILEDGLEEAIVAMPEEAKQRFLQKGREIGTIVADMVRRYKVEVKRVLHLVKEWLTAIPGVNKFFLEKEAKIKTDRILELERLRHEIVPA